ncbi:myosin-X, partial [Reticulomyxa filosa]
EFVLKKILLIFNQNWRMKVIATSFNELHQQDNEEEEKDKEKEQKKKKKQMKCAVYNPQYATKQKERRKQEVEDPETNRFVLLKNVSPSESEEEIAEALKDMGYNKQTKITFHPVHEVFWFESLRKRLFLITIQSLHHHYSISAAIGEQTMMN